MEKFRPVRKQYADALENMQKNELKNADTVPVFEKRPNHQPGAHRGICAFLARKGYPGGNGLLGARAARHSI
ncbi:hypothetical protein DPMN_007705 [Dreissena polymorpha]|uniref:Uncharacterized protein n=1 Tax=Dreissena polymorpha TaxID=45954 RepID=A0A9D4RYL1_DREPO|nr:hypothetical protein DPMN_007705 [Dreissena polymorpha]